MVKIKDTEAFAKILRLYNNKKNGCNSFTGTTAVNIMISDRMSSFQTLKQVKIRNWLIVQACP